MQSVVCFLLYNKLLKKIIAIDIPVLKNISIVE